MLAHPVAAVLFASGMLATPGLSGSSPFAARETSPATTSAARQIFVAVHGNNAAPGSRKRPLATIDAAIARAHPGDTIMLRGGNYQQSIEVAKSGLTIRNYPGEDVVLDGTSPVTGWRQAGAVWVRDGWTHRFDHSPTYTWGAPDNTSADWSFVNASHPMAAWPDMVFVDGRPLLQVATPAQVGPGRFAVDYNSSQLYVGTNPTGHEVRASTRDKAITVKAADTVLQGMTVRGFASSVPHMGSITLEAPRAQLRQLVVSDNATTGISALADDITLSRVTASHNGMLGIHASGAYNLSLRHVKVVRNNTEHFNQAPVSGGMKVHRSRNITVRNSVFRGNNGTGAWFDVSNHTIRFLNNRVLNNTGHGLFLEISDTAVVAGNVFAGSGGHGLQVDNTGHVRVWNNAFLGNARPINIVQDDRNAADLTFPGYDPRRPKPDPTVPWITRDVQVVNNVVSSPSGAGNCLLCVEDYTKVRSAEEMGVTANANVYRRLSVTNPRWLVVWSSGDPNPHVFETLDMFRGSTGQEAQGRAVGKRVLKASGLPTRFANRLAKSMAVALPSDIAQLLGRPAGARHLGPWR